MKRIQEKVKDIVEVRSYQSLRDFTADPALTLSSYHFTDVTADLMAKWLDQISNVQVQSGAACALAGYRGVGKSHFLATLGALAAHPELRTKIGESHVSASAQRLLRRHYPVAYIRRGTHATLLEEFKDAVAVVFELDQASLGDSFAGILKTVSEKTGELPFILIIDTAFERGSRVTRDDGVFLSEIADAAKDLNTFVGVALDDDIAGADGSNSSIVRAYAIDYLDQEHLYKVVNSHIFPKQNQMQPVLHEIYDYFRKVLPSFRWSEQKFAALYPLHPAILEVAPYVRLYVHDFALLGFASEAGERILGRPANSLIALDEVFDNAEAGLRKIEDLSEAFAAYDALNSGVVSKIPVMQRLQAKLILKALLLLSLDGQGTTTNDICASMLIFDESNPEKAIKTVEELIKNFADEMPNDVRSISVDGLETRYGFKVSSKDNLNKALTEAIADVPDDVVPKIMGRLLQDRFSDCTFSFEADSPVKDWMDCQINWRGGWRRGRIFWKSDENSSQVHSAPAVDATDWEITVDLQKDQVKSEKSAGDISKVIWRPDILRKDETDTILRYYVLSSNNELREKFAEQIRTSVHSHAVLVNKIFTRRFLEDGKLIIEGFDYNFTEEARSAPTFSEMFSTMLEPLFETRYPEHPHFTQRLGMSEVAELVTDLYSGTRQNLAEAQHLAQTFAMPLGLVRVEGGVYIPESEENLSVLPLAVEILKLVEANGEDTVSLKDIYSQLRKAPHGLVREAQHLILTALVAQRRIDFVTSKGDRITSRSLDLKIIWDDIVGVAKPIYSSYSIKKLIRWAEVFTGNQKFKSFESPADREILRKTFEDWIGEWNNSRILGRFADLPDDILNVRIWNLAARSSKTIGSVADCVKAASEDSMSLEECLDRIADAFFDSEKEMEKCYADLETLDHFIKGAVLRTEIQAYLAVCEMTDDESVEELRRKLMQISDVSYSTPTDANNRELGYLWSKFQRSFADYFSARHEMVMKSHSLQEEYDEVMRSDIWWEFQNLSSMPFFERAFWMEARSICRQLDELDCGVDVQETLATRPFCRCSFSLAKIAHWEKLPDRLRETVGQGLESYREILRGRSDNIASPLEQLAAESKDSEVSASARELSKILSQAKEIPPFNILQLKLLSHVLTNRTSADTTAVIHPQKEGINTEAILEESERMTGEWNDKVADDAVLMNL
ncbi:MAG: hypothetical protein H7070_10945 [Saprospiraceae bacterium]|nr:hypothetical protein [Pyrinomonadaceae bacterium]